MKIVTIIDLGSIICRPALIGHGKIWSVWQPFAGHISGGSGLWCASTTAGRLDPEETDEPVPGRPTAER